MQICREVHIGSHKTSQNSPDSGGTWRYCVTAYPASNQSDPTLTTLTQQCLQKSLMSQLLSSSKVVATSSPVALSSIAHRSQRECHWKSVDFMRCVLANHAIHIDSPCQKSLKSYRNMAQKSFVSTSVFRMASHPIHFQICMAGVRL